MAIVVGLAVSLALVTVAAASLRRAHRSRCSSGLTAGLWLGIGALYMAVMT